MISTNAPDVGNPRPSLNGEGNYSLSDFGITGPRTTPEPTPNEMIKRDVAAIKAGETLPPSPTEEELSRDCAPLQISIANDKARVQQEIAETNKCIQDFAADFAKQIESIKVFQAKYNASGAKNVQANTREEAVGGAAETLEANEAVKAEVATLIDQATAIQSGLGSVYSKGNDISERYGTLHWVCSTLKSCEVSQLESQIAQPIKSASKARMSDFAALDPASSKDTYDAEPTSVQAVPQYISPIKAFASTELAELRALQDQFGGQTRGLQALSEDGSDEPVPETPASPTAGDTAGTPGNTSSGNGGGSSLPSVVAGPAMDIPASAGNTPSFGAKSSIPWGKVAIGAVVLGGGALAIGALTKGKKENRQPASGTTTASAASSTGRSNADCPVWEDIPSTNPTVLAINAENRAINAACRAGQARPAN